MPGVARATFLFYYGLKPGRFPRLNLSTFNLGVTFQLCSHPRSLYPQRKPVISCNKAWKNSKGALKVPRTDTEKAGASTEKPNVEASWAPPLREPKSRQSPSSPVTPGRKRHTDPQSLGQNGAPGGRGVTRPGRPYGGSALPRRGGQSEAGAAAWPGGARSPFSRAPLSLLPHDQASPGSSSPASPPSLPSPPPHRRTRPPPPPKPTNFPVPPLLPTFQEHAEIAGQEAPQNGPHLPFSHSLLSPARGGPKRGRRGAGAAAAAAGLHAHASQLSRERRKKRARQGSARAAAAAAAAALSTAPLRPGLARRQRLLPCRRLLPRRPASPAQLLIQPLPLTQRRRDMPPAAFMSRRRGLPARGRAPSLGAASRAFQKRRGGRAHGLGWETPGDVRGEQRRAGGERPPGGAFQWDSFPGRPLRPSPRRA